MKLSNQALGAIMMALQKSLMEQTDIVPTLQNLQFQVGDEECLIVLNPPNFKISNEVTTIKENKQSVGTTGSD